MKCAGEESTDDIVITEEGIGSSLILFINNNNGRMVTLLPSSFYTPLNGFQCVFHRPLWYKNLR